MKIVAVVPIKMNNERLANKNIKKFSNGRPLCSYILDTLADIDIIDESYVYCSDDVMKEYIPTGIRFLKRPQELDTNCSTMNDVLNSFADKIDSDIYILTHATAPFIKKETIIDCLKKIIEEGYDSAFTVQKINDFLWEDGSPLNYDLTNIPRTQDLPNIYKETCGLYVFKKDVLKMMNRRIGNKAYMYEIDSLEAIDINNGFDFEIANHFASIIENGTYKN